MKKAVRSILPRSPILALATRRSLAAISSHTMSPAHYRDVDDKSNHGADAKGHEGVLELRRLVLSALHNAHCDETHQGDDDGDGGANVDARRRALIATTYGVAVVVRGMVMRMGRPADALRLDHHRLWPRGPAICWLRDINHLGLWLKLSPGISRIPRLSGRLLINYLLLNGWLLIDHLLNGGLLLLLVDHLLLHLLWGLGHPILLGFCPWIKGRRRLTVRGRS